MNREAASSAVDIMTGLLAVVAALMFVFVMTISQTANDEAEKQARGERIAVLTTFAPAGSKTKFELRQGTDVTTVVGEGVAILRLTGDATQKIQVHVAAAAPGPRLAWAAPLLREIARERGAGHEDWSRAVEHLASRIAESEPAALASDIAPLLSGLATPALATASDRVLRGALRLKLGTISAALREQSWPSFRLETFDGPTPRSSTEHQVASDPDTSEWESGFKTP